MSSSSKPSHDELLMAAILLGRKEPLAPHHVSALRERLGERTDNELRWAILTGHWPQWPEVAP